MITKRKNKNELKKKNRKKRFFFSLSFHVPKSILILSPFLHPFFIFSFSFLKWPPRCGQRPPGSCSVSSSNCDDRCSGIISARRARASGGGRRRRRRRSPCTRSLRAGLLSSRTARASPCSARRLPCLHSSAMHPGSLAWPNSSKGGRRRSRAGERKFFAFVFFFNHPLRSKSPLLFSSLSLTSQHHLQKKPTPTPPTTQPGLPLPSRQPPEVRPRRRALLWHPQHPLVRLLLRHRLALRRSGSQGSRPRRERQGRGQSLCARLGGFAGDKGGEDRGRGPGRSAGGLADRLDSQGHGPSLPEGGLWRGRRLLRRGRDRGRRRVCRRLDLENDVFFFDPVDRLRALARVAGLVKQKGRAFLVFSFRIRV